MLILFQTRLGAQLGPMPGLSLRKTGRIWVSGERLAPSVMMRGKTVRLDRIVLGVMALVLLQGLSASVDEAAAPLKIVTNSQDKIVMEFSCPQVRIEKSSLNGEVFSRVSLEGSEPAVVNGMPDLPVYGSLVAIPVNCVSTVSFQLSDPQIFLDVKPSPVAEESEAVTLANVYYGDAVYPSRQVIESEAVFLRDFRVLPLQISPLSWNPLTHTLTRYGKIQISIDLSYPDTDGGPMPYTGYSYAFRNIYEARIQNFSGYRDLEPGPQPPKVLIIHGSNTDPVFVSRLSEFVSWKRQKGFIVNTFSTKVAGATSTAIKSFIQSRYDDPETRPDYIILIGDVSGSFAVPTFFETDSEYNGEGDYPYTYLNGNDMLGDAFIGRMSAEDVSQLLTLYSKVYTYEKNVNINHPLSAWMNRMLLIGDPSVSGSSCVYTARYIREIAQFANPGYNFVENYTSGFPSTINSGLNQGVGFFAYRGYYGVSGWSPSSSVVNGFKLPHAVIITCQTGSFAGTSLSEQFIRMGTESVPAGAATCIGMSTSGTHTGYNNTLISGIMSGIFCHGMRTMGEALLNGKLYMYETFGATQPVAVKSLTHWCNLMGDPTLETWVGVAKKLNLEVPASFPLGLSTLEVTVRDSLQAPLEGVSVTAFSAVLDSVVASAFTSADGVAVLDLPAGLETGLLITASKSNFKPEQQNLPIDASGTLAYTTHQVIDDGSGGSSGNANGIANASETVALSVTLRNFTASGISGLNATLACEHPGIQLSVASTAYPDLGPGASGAGSQPFILTINPSISPLESVRFVINATDSNSNNYPSVFFLNVCNARLSVTEYIVNDGSNGILDPGDECSLGLQVNNAADYPALDLFGELQSLNGLLVVVDSLSYFGNVMPHSQVLATDAFQIRARSNLVAGMQLPMRVRFYNSAGFEQICLFHIPVGSVSQNTPLGPDEYGYLIYDETDTAYPDCPVYDWVEIVPELGGRGSLIPDLYDTGSGSTEGEAPFASILKDLPLPFSFRFYGLDYDRITVCVNGFIALGSTDNGDFRNVHLPGGQGPNPMIAAFWDDLILKENSGIYQYYDEETHRYIIQYHQLANGYDKISEETFQVIFYDPLYHHNGLADGIVKLQYKTFNNVDAGGPGLYEVPLHGNYCTVGIKDHSNTRGLEYSFNNSYPQAAAPLANQKALLITTVPVHHQAAYLVMDQILMYDGNNQIPEPGEDYELGLKLRNLGLEQATTVSAELSCQSPYAQVTSSQSLYADIHAAGSSVNLTPFVISVADSCPDGSVLSFHLEVSYAGNSRSFNFTMIVKRPAVEYSGYLICDLEGDGNGILEPGDTAVLVVNFKNSSLLEARNLSATLSSSDEHVTLIDSSRQIVCVPAGSTVQAAFGFTLASAAAIGAAINLELGFVCDLMSGHSAQIQVPVGTSGLYDDFEASSGSYVAIPSSSGWQWGSDQTAGSHSGSKVWGTMLNQQYGGDLNLRLLSPSINIGPDNWLEFWQSYDTQSGYDGGRIEIYAGGSWTVLTPEDGYPSAHVTALNGPGFSGYSGWSRVRCDLGAYANNTVRFRWVFASDASVSGQGWFIDDVRTIGFAASAGKLSGSINLDGALPELYKVWIGIVDGIAVNPCLDKTYTLYLPLGIHAVSASAPGFNTHMVTGVDLSLENLSQQLDLEIHELKPVTGLASSHSEAVLDLCWEAPSEPFFPVTGYKITRRINAGAFETAAIVADVHYSELLSIMGTYRYYVQAIYNEGESLPSPVFSTVFPFPDEPPLPQVSRLLANYPNPFNPSTTISFELARPGRTSLKIYNLKGQLLITLCDLHLEPGRYRYTWDGKDSNRQRVSSGVYFYRLAAPGYQKSRKMLLLK